MSHGPSFENKVTQALSDEEKREQEAIALAERRARTIAMKRERDAAHQGTPPSEVFSPSDNQLCAEFVEFAKKRSFAGASTVQRPPRKRFVRSFERQSPTQYYDRLLNGAEVITHFPKGYLIGSTNFFFVASKSFGNLKGERVAASIEDGGVYLCEDGMLRENRGLSLPLDKWGDVICPVIGDFEARWSPPREPSVEDGAPWPGGTFVDATYFSLETKLTRLALQIEHDASSH